MLAPGWWDLGRGLAESVRESAEGWAPELANPWAPWGSAWVWGWVRDSASVIRWALALPMWRARERAAVVGDPIPAER